MKRQILTLALMLMLSGLFCSKPVKDSSFNENSNTRNREIVTVTVGDGSQQGRIPTDNIWHTILYQCLYMEDEIGLEGYIQAIQFYPNFSSDHITTPFYVWLGVTDSDNLEQRWISSTLLTQVFADTVLIPYGDTVWEIPLQQPFYYNGGNLVLTAFSPIHGLCYCPPQYYHTQTIEPSRARKAYHDFTIFDPEYPPEPTTAQLTGMFPKTSFVIETDHPPFGSLNGAVFAGGVPVENAFVKITGTSYHAFTDASGTFSISEVIAGTHVLKIQKHGFVNFQQTINITENQAMSVTAQLLDLPLVTVTGRVTGSDFPATGLADAEVNLSLYENYNTVSDANGIFSFPAVMGLSHYNYTINCPGYYSSSGTLVLNDTDTDLGVLILQEIYYPPEAVDADVAEDNTGVLVTWTMTNNAGDTAGHDRNNTRDLTSYTIWRMLAENIYNPNEWTLLGTVPSSQQSYFDTYWYLLPDNNYCWAVKAVYTGGGMSYYSISPAIVKDFQYGTLTGRIVNQQNENIHVATLHIGPYYFNSLPAAAGTEYNYSASLPEGIYTITVFAYPYEPVEVNDVQIIADQTHILHIPMYPVGNDDNVISVDKTELLGNYPNPFNPDTKIKYALKEAGRIELTIYDIKGNLVKSYRQNHYQAGYYEIDWSGKDSHGKSVSSGIYYYRLESNGIRYTKKMVLLK